MGVSFQFKPHVNGFKFGIFLILLMLGLCLMISFKNFIFIELGFLATI